MNIVGDNGPMGNNRGAGPATSVPPVYPAIKITDENQRSSGVTMWAMFRESAVEETTEPSICVVEEPSAECDDGAVIEIDKKFRHAVWALQFLPRRDRPAALQMARDERASAMRYLREKRDVERRWRRTLRRLQTLKPRG